MRAIGTPNRASGVQTRRSQASAIAQPPPAATPSTCAIVGDRDALEAIDDGVEPALVGDARRRGVKARELADVGAGGERLAARALQNEHADRRGRRRRGRRPAASASYISHVIAFRASGRLNVSDATGPSMANERDEEDT